MEQHNNLITAATIGGRAFPAALSHGAGGTLGLPPAAPHRAGVPPTPLTPIPGPSPQAAAPGRASSGDFFERYEFVREEGENGISGFRCCGSGSFGCVCVVREKPTNILRACKLVYLNPARAAAAGAGGPASTHTFTSEVDLMKQLRPYALADPGAAATLLLLLDDYTEVTSSGMTLLRQIYELSPACQPTLLPSHPRNREPQRSDWADKPAQGSSCDLYDGTACRPLALRQATFVALQLLTATAFLHQHNIVHRDIKAESESGVRRALILCAGSAR